jgi:hypothetical protein
LKTIAVLSMAAKIDAGIKGHEYPLGAVDYL